jgi:hypothetical protein
MSKKTKSEVLFIRTTFMILLTLMGFMVGFAVGRSISSVETNRKTVVPQIRIVPKESEKTQEQYVQLFLYEL